MVRWVWASVLGTLLVSVRAQAQLLESDKMPVVLRSADGASLRIQGEGIPNGSGLCFQTCTLQLAPGTYTVSFPSGGSLASRPFTVLAPSEVVVNGGSGFQRGLGLGLIIGGGTVLSAGGIVAYTDANLRLNSEEYCDIDSTQCYSSPAWVLPVEIAGGIGLGAAVVGIVLFVTAKPSVDVKALNESAASRSSTALSRFHFTPELGKNRTGLNVDWSF